MNIDAMPAGRELDALVAEKVLGYAVSKMDGLPEVDRYILWERVPILPDGGMDRPLRHYSTDIAAAWDVLAHFMCLRVGPEFHPAKDGRSCLYKPVVEFSFYEHDDIYVIRIGRCKGTGGDDDIVCETNEWEDVPLLICLAALKAVGVAV